MGYFPDDIVDWLIEKGDLGQWHVVGVYRDGHRTTLVTVKMHNELGDIWGGEKRQALAMRIVRQVETMAKGADEP